MSPVHVPPRPSRGARPPEPPDPLDAADETLARVRASLKDATDDEITGKHEITVNVNTVPAPVRVPQPSAHDLSEYVSPAVSVKQLLAALGALAAAGAALAKALGLLG